MSITFVSIKCPECGAALSIEEDRKQAFCSYCGAKVIVNNENEYVYRHIDEARVKQVEVAKSIRLKELEIEERERERERLDNAKRTKRTMLIAIAWIVITAAFLLLGPVNEICYFIGGGLVVVGIWVGLFAVISRDERKKEEIARKNQAAGLIRLDIEIESIKKKSYSVLESELRAMGFNNIQCISLRDGFRGLLKEGKVETVSVGGKDITDSDSWVHPSIPIVISYHGNKD